MDSTTTWQQVIDKFIKDLNPMLGYNEDITVFTGAMQTVAETLIQYLERMRRLYKKVAGILKEEQAVSILMDNVHPYYRPHIQVYDCKTFREAEIRFRRVERFCNRNPVQNAVGHSMENALARMETANTADIVKTVLAAVQPNQQKETRKCFYCDKIGHIASDCRKKAKDRQRAEQRNNSNFNEPNGNNQGTMNNNGPFFQNQQWGSNQQPPQWMHNQHQQQWQRQEWQGRRPDGQRTLAWQGNHNADFNHGQSQNDQRSGWQERGRSPSPNMVSKNGHGGQRSGPRQPSQ
jgi:hypothetical protein